MAESTGLLDFLNSPGGMGLLSAVGAGLAGARRGGTWNAVGSGLLGGVQGYAQGQDLQRQNEYAAQRGKLFDMQAQQLEAAQAAAKAEAEKRGKLNDYLGTIGQYKDDFSTQQNKFDPMQFVRLGGSIAEAEKMAGMGDWGRAEVARTLESQDAQGNKVTLQFDKFGRPVGDGVQGYAAPVQVDLGGRVQFVKPQAGVNLTKTMTPGEIASNSVARGNLAVSQQRLAMDQRKADAETASGGYSTKPLPAAAMKMQNDALDVIAASSNIDKLLADKQRQIASGSLSFGPVSNLVNKGRNLAGQSNEQSRNFASFASDLERMRNESLRLNAGVQTDGDAQRAWNELFQNINDTNLVSQRLNEIRAINKRAVELQRLKIDQVRGNYQAAPFDYSRLPGAGDANTAQSIQPEAKPQGKTVVRTGTMNGRKVVQYSDGTTAYAD